MPRSPRRLPATTTETPPAPARYRIGSLDVFVVSDGTLKLDAGAAFGLIPRTMWERYVGDQLDAEHRFPIGLNCLLLRSAGKTVVIETGVGDKDAARTDAGPEGVGVLRRNLARIGVRPEDVDIVVNTHLHSDHCGGNTALGDRGAAVPAFPNARYVVNRGEWEVANQPNERTRATYLSENLAPVAACGQLDLYEGEHAVTDEVRIIATPGHTADHASVVITSGSESAIYIGDVAQHTVQLERYAWISAFDVLPLVSLETKKRLVEDAIENSRMLIAVHGPYPGVGRMESDGKLRHWRDVAPLAEPVAGITSPPGPLSDKRRGGAGLTPLSRPGRGAEGEGATSMEQVSGSTPS